MSLLTPSRPVYLPSHDPDPAERSARLNAKRESYRLSHDLAGITLAAEFPSGDGFGALYLAKVGGLVAKLKLAELRAAKDLDDALLPSGMPKRRPTSMAEYDAFFKQIGVPGSAEYWDKDWYFAWQRLAGSTPMLLRNFPKADVRFPVTDAIYQQTVQGRDTLDAAFAEGRLFMLDYPLLMGIEGGVVEGHQKHVSSPMALFAMLPGEGGPKERFVPIGIQCSPEPVEDARIWTPQDGVRWQMARYTVQCADMFMHETAMHTAAGHMITEAVVLVSHRELAPNHPLFLLLEPHFEFTIAANNVARNSFLNPGGLTDRLAGGTLEHSLNLINRQIAAIRLDSFGPVQELAARGVDNVETLPFYPYRDDALLFMEAIHAWVDGYLRLYYQHDEDVAEDNELRAWAWALGDSDQGKLQGVPALETIEMLVGLVSNIIWVICALHSCTNYSGWEFGGYPVNMSPGAYAGPPTLSHEPGEADFLAMMPPLNLAWETVDLMYQLRNITMNDLTDTGERSFDDVRVKPILSRFNAALNEVQGQIALRNSDRIKRPIGYGYLGPHHANQSVHA